MNRKSFHQEIPLGPEWEERPPNPGSLALCDSTAPAVPAFIIGRGRGGGGGGGLSSSAFLVISLGFTIFGEIFANVSIFGEIFAHVTIF